MEHPYKNEAGAPITDILSEIRQLISDEADQRYTREREVTRTEMLILRPESRVDLLVQEPEQVIEVQAVPQQVEAEARPELTEPPQQAPLIEEPSLSELRALIREIVLEELAREKALDWTA